GVAGVDLDHARDPQTGAIKPWARAILATFPGTYIEVSPSGMGLHVLCLGSVPKGTRRPYGGDGGMVEMYDRDRFFTYTGDHLPDVPDALVDHTTALAALQARIASP